MFEIKQIYLPTISDMPVVAIILIILTVIYYISIFYLFIGLFNLPKYTNSRKHFLSVIIAAHNEESKIAQCIQGIINQDYPNDKYEIIIADDRSTDGTPEIISRYCADNQLCRSVRVEDEKDVIPKKTALIKGLSEVQGEIIVSTDADCNLPATWLSSLNNYFADDVGMVIGHTGYTRQKGFWKGIDALDYLSQRALGAAFIGIGYAYTCTASNFAYRKEIFETNKEEFSRIKVRPAEDNYLLHCVHMKSPYKIAVATDSGSFVSTEGASSFSHFLNQRFRWGAYGGNIVTFGVKLFFIPTLLFYFSLWICFILSFFITNLFLMLLISLGCKMFVDFLFVLRSVTLFKCSYLLKYFLPISLFHLILIPVIVLKGNLFTFEWKGRRYTIDREVIK